MQTFLPYPSYQQSAEVLDRQRLGKQRVEAWQILRTLLGQSTGWRNHPAIRMWRSYEASLVRYANAVCEEWCLRGYEDSIGLQLLELNVTETDEDPPWLGWEEFHLSHQSNLLRKDPAYYGVYFTGVPNNLPYIWPEA